MKLHLQFDKSGRTLVHGEGEFDGGFADSVGGGDGVLLDHWLVGSSDEERNDAHEIHLVRKRELNGELSVDSLDGKWTIQLLLSIDGNQGRDGDGRLPSGNDFHDAGFRIRCDHKGTHENQSIGILHVEVAEGHGTHTSELVVELNTRNANSVVLFFFGVEGTIVVHLPIARQSQSALCGERKHEVEQVSVLSLRNREGHNHGCQSSRVGRRDRELSRLQLLRCHTRSQWGTKHGLDTNKKLNRRV